MLTAAFGEAFDAVEQEDESIILEPLAVIRGSLFSSTSFFALEIRSMIFTNNRLSPCHHEACGSADGVRMDAIAPPTSSLQIRLTGKRGLLSTGRPSPRHRLAKLLGGHRAGDSPPPEQQETTLLGGWPCGSQGEQLYSGSPIFISRSSR